MYVRLIWAAAIASGSLEKTCTWITINKCMPPGCTPSTGGKGVPVLLEISGLGETTR